MVSVASFLIPIVISAVFVFIASSIIHTATPWHKNDFKKVPDEDGVLRALRPFNLQPGEYGFPKPDSMKDMQSPEFQEKLKPGDTLKAEIEGIGAMNLGVAREQ